MVNVLLLPTSDLTLPNVSVKTHLLILLLAMDANVQRDMYSIPILIAAMIYVQTMTAMDMVHVTLLLGNVLAMTALLHQILAHVSVHKDTLSIQVQILVLNQS